MKRIKRQDQLSLNKIWTNIFLRFSGEIVGNDTRADYFIISEDENKYRITLATNQVDKWRCMVEPTIALRYNSIRDGYGRYTKEVEKFAACICKGHIEYDPKGNGNAKRNVNLKYEELLEYLIKKGNGIIEQEIGFLKETIINSCCLKLYLNDQLKKGSIINEVSVKKETILEYRQSFKLKKIESLVRGYLENYYEGCENVDVIDLLSIVIMRTIVEVTVDDEEGKQVKNVNRIFQLQEQFIQSIEDYLSSSGKKPPEIVNISLYVEWRSKFTCVRRELIDSHGYPETGELIHALDNLEKIRSAEIGNTIFGIFESHVVRELRDKLNDEMKQLDELLKKLEIYREYINGLRERNALENENENLSFLEQVVPRVLKLDNLV